MGDRFGVCDSLVAGDNVDIVLSANSPPVSTHRGLINSQIAERPEIDC